MKSLLRLFFFSSFSVVMLHITNILVPFTGLLMSLVPLWLLECFKLVSLKASKLFDLP